MRPARLVGISPGAKGRRAVGHHRSFHRSSCRRISVGRNAPGVCRRTSRRHRRPQIGRFAPAPFYKRHSLLGHFLSALLRNAENAPIGQRGCAPLDTPCAFLGAQGFFVWKVINLADLPGWVKKSPRVRGGFFSVLVNCDILERCRELLLKYLYKI